MNTQKPNQSFLAEFSNQTRNGQLYHHAVQGDDGTIQPFIKSDQDINSVDDEGCTALHRAVQNGNIDMVHCLIARGAMLNIINNEGDTPLHMALKFKETIIAILLLEHDADTTQQPDGWKSTPLHLSISYHLDIIVSKLLLLPVDIQAQDFAGNTPLHLAAKMGNLKFTQLLLNRGAAVNIVNSCGKTPLECSLQEEDLQTAIDQYSIDGIFFDRKDLVHRYDYDEVRTELQTHGAI